MNNGPFIWIRKRKASAEAKLHLIMLWTHSVCPMSVDNFLWFNVNSHQFAVVEFDASAKRYKHMQQLAELSACSLCCFRLWELVDRQLCVRANSQGLKCQRTRRERWSVKGKKRRCAIGAPWVYTCVCEWVSVTLRSVCAFVSVCLCVN